MTVTLEIQRAVDDPNLPSDSHFQAWANLILEQDPRLLSVTLRLVDAEEMQGLNLEFRHKNYPTNILSFPYDEFDQDPEEKTFLLGDLVISVPVVLAEAKAQNKTVHEHFAHLVIHGILHLLGYDHEEDQEAVRMENLEVQYLSKLGYGNPYESS